MTPDTVTGASGPLPSSASIRHRCYLCSRTYERHDHLNRHLKSHDNERSHRCPDCGKGFNRADLLNRHRAAHAKTSTGDVFRKRTPRACENCIKAKTKCDDERPCRRCSARDIVCQDTDARDECRSDGHASPTSPSKHASGRRVTQPPTPASMRQPEVPQTQHEPFLAPLTPAPCDPDHFAMGSSVTDTGFSDFFEQIMMPGVMATELHDRHSMPPLNLSDFTQDINLDTFDFDFSFLADGLTRPSSPQPPNAFAAVDGDDGPSSQSDAHLRSEALSRSPWAWNNWMPERNHSAFTGQDVINAQADRVNAADQHVSPSVKRSVHCDLTQEARDRMIRTVTQTASSRLAMPSFPSLELLEDLIDIFLLQHGGAIDSFIHVPTFACREARTELLLAATAAGSRFVALPPVWRMGLILQEVARLAIGELFEADNSLTRDLSVVQAYLLWISVGTWSGFRRKTEIACSLLSPAVTMLSWSNSFTKFRYIDIMPSTSDSDDALFDKWKNWLEQEGRKRLVLHSFIHDSQVAICHCQNRLISPSQLMLPLPASRDVWLAPNAFAWRDAFLAVQSPPSWTMHSVMEIFGNTGILDRIESAVDKPLCLMVACHALAQEVSQFRQESQILQNWQQTNRQDRWLTHLNRQRDLLEDLTTLGAYCELSVDTAPEITLTIEMLMMSLHVSLEDIQAFTGKSGEDEARKAYPRLRAWVTDSSSRTAVWHAGQVLRIARSFQKTTLRDFYAVALHQATLTLWAYGMVTSNEARKSCGDTSQQQEPTSATNRSSGDTASLRIFVDEVDDRSARSFKLLGQGTAGVRQRQSTEPESNQQPQQPAFCPLSDSRELMRVSEDILRANFPTSSSGLPPLVDNLASLMTDLGRLSRR